MLNSYKYLLHGFHWDGWSRQQNAQISRDSDLSLEKGV
jgi:hypothetical protein